MLKHHKAQSHQSRCPVTALRCVPTDLRRSPTAYADQTPQNHSFSHREVSEWVLILRCQIPVTAELIQDKKFRFEFQNFLGVVRHRSWYLATTRWCRFFQTPPLCNTNGNLNKFDRKTGKNGKERDLDVFGCYQKSLSI